MRNTNSVCIVVKRQTRNLTCKTTINHTHEPDFTFTYFLREAEGERAYLHVRLAVELYVLYKSKQENVMSRPTWLLRLLLFHLACDDFESQHKWNLKCTPHKDVNVMNCVPFFCFDVSQSFSLTGILGRRGKNSASIPTQRWLLLQLICTLESWREKPETRIGLKRLESDFWMMSTLKSFRHSKSMLPANGLVIPYFWVLHACSSSRKYLMSDHFFDALTLKKRTRSPYSFTFTCNYPNANT